MAPTLEEFGHGTLVQNGRPAVGGRPCMIVLAEYSDKRPFSDFHTLDYYQRLGFGNPSEVPFYTSKPDGSINPASLTEFFRENSHGKFWFDPIAVFGPIAMDKYDPALCGNPEFRLQMILDRLPDQLFDRLDVNQNNAISSDELCVVAFENLEDLQPANRVNNPVDVRIFSPMSFPLMFVDKVVAVRVAGAGPKTPFFQIAHELAHSIEAKDLYGTGNSMLTIMGEYSFFSDDQATVHLDVWHKMKLGWVEPRRFDLATAGSELVHTGPDGTLLLWNTDKLAKEYFLVERRRPMAADRKYDWNVYGDGVLIWHVGSSLDQFYHLGATAMVPGRSQVWTAGMQTALLRWADGTRIGKSILINQATDGALRVEWVDRGIELKVSEPEYIDVGSSVYEQQTDHCGNVLKIGKWETKTTVTFTVSEILGLNNPALGWTLQNKPLAAGRAFVTVAVGAAQFVVDCELSADLRTLSLSSLTGDVYEMIVRVSASDATGLSSSADYLFVVPGSYTGMRWEDIAAATECIADTVPITIDVGGFTMPWEKKPVIDFRPIPLEWPGWKVQEWASGALARLDSDTSLDATVHEAIRQFIDLQVSSPRFRLAAQDLMLRRQGGTAKTKVSETNATYFGPLGGASC